MSLKNPVRSSKLVGQFGVGSLIEQGGISNIICGIDDWYPPEANLAAGGDFFDDSEFIIREPRLEERLQVGSFRRPPDYRERRAGSVVPNANLTIPTLRFPQTHVCAFCGLMRVVPLTASGAVLCAACAARGFRSVLSQVSFVGICARGHLQDIPWREWVHRQLKPVCQGELYFERTGSSTLAGQRIKCAGCGAKRSLLNIDKANLGDTYLSFNLSREGIFFCQGGKPWLGMPTGGGCSAYLLGNPRNAGNVWFSQVMSAISIPRSGNEKKAELRKFFERADVQAKIRALGNRSAEDVIEILKLFYPAYLENHSGEQIGEVLRGGAGQSAGRRPGHDGTRGGGAAGVQSLPVIVPGITSLAGKTSLEPEPEVTEAEFRYPEYLQLRESTREKNLLTKRIELGPEAPLVQRSLDRVVQVHRLKETRALSGFSRISSNNALPLEERKMMLRLPFAESPEAFSARSGTSAIDSDWLPAIEVYGEGIYLELSAKRIASWLKDNGCTLERHLMPLHESLKGAGCPGGGQSAGRQPAAGAGGETVCTHEKISPVFIVLHTVSHLLMSQLIFESGYSSAALRERIYYSEKKETPMAGVLIYTADGDSEGTLGGLVRLGTPANLEKLLRRALDGAAHCWHDPACSEIGAAQGQGPDNCNLAACHACALISETACEEFNKFLDRSLLVELPGATIVPYF